MGRQLRGVRRFAWQNWELTVCYTVPRLRPYCWLHIGFGIGTWGVEADVVLMDWSLFWVRTEQPFLRRHITAALLGLQVRADGRVQ
jgi:hypothetical protein